MESKLTVQDPDHIQFTTLNGRVFERITDPPPASPRCESGNVYHVQAKYAVSRAFHLNEAKQYEQSNCWYRIAADLGDPAGVQGLGYAYGMGMGVPKDPAKSFQLESAAAEQGNLFAQADMVFDYTNGYGVTKDRKRRRSGKLNTISRFRPSMPSTARLSRTLKTAQRRCAFSRT